MPLPRCRAPAPPSAALTALAALIAVAPLRAQEPDSAQAAEKERVEQPLPLEG